MKVVEGWFKKPMLEAFFRGADAWYDGIINGTAPDATSAATTAAADVVGKAISVVSTSVNTVAKAAIDLASAATPSAEAAGETAKAAGTVIMNWNILGLFKMIFVSGKDLASSKLSDYAFKLDVPLMNWFVDKVILPVDGIQLAMQIFIVLAEILIGLALIGGLLTTPAAAFSLVLQFMFLCTTGLYLGNSWMVFAGIVVLIGAGRSLGLDYYAMPAIKKWWKKLPFVRKWYIYND